MNSQLKTIIVFFLVLYSCNIVAQETKRKSTKATNVAVLEKEFIIDGLNDISHKVWLYLPPNYNSSNQTYPVIYMHDAQNLFDDATSFIGEWSVDEILNDYFTKTGKGFIVVGFENGRAKRIEEYTPWKHEKYGGGKGVIYVDFLVKELKPYIDKNYRTKTGAKSTAIIGSSLGGLISFYGGLKYPDVFGKIGAMSTSFWFSNQVNEFAKQNGNLQNTRLHLLVGGKEGESMVPNTLNIEKLLIATGFNKNNLTTKVVAEGKHNEAFWKSEFLEVVNFLFE